MIVLMLGAWACGGGAVGLTPSAGHWTVIDNQVAQDDCGLIQADPPNGIPQGYSVTTGDEGSSFVLQGDLENDLQQCAAEGEGWACLPYDETESGSQQGATYTMTYTWQYTGEMQDEGAMQIDIELQLSCAGSVELCADIERSFEISFPCHLSVSQQATAD